MKWFALLLTVVGLRVFGWGEEGHVLVARLAQNHLTPKTLAQVRKILATNDLGSVAVWADEARQMMRYHTGALAGNKEAADFVRAFPHNGDWHFVDLPLGTFQYLPDGRFASTNDIIHALSNCVAVLEGKSKLMTQAQALRYVIHLVGDLHQPLHVACGYYMASDGNLPRLITDPEQVVDKKAEDHGANLLWINGKKSHNLHSFWDDQLVKDVTKRATPAQRLNTLELVMDQKKWKSKGNYHNWPARWAKESVDEAVLIYNGVHFTGEKFTTRGEPSEIDITLDADYESKEAQLAAEQLAKGGFHLAELLNRIKWAAP